MSSKGRKIAKNLGKSLRKKFESDSQNDDFQQRFAELNLSRGSPTHHTGTEMKSSSVSTSAPGVVGKSTSLSTIGSEPGDPVVVDHSEIIALTHDVKNFSDTLAKLKILFIEGLEPGDDSRVISHESLGEVLAVLKSTLQRYSALQSPEIFTAARVLITKIKSHNYEEEMDEEDLQLFLDAIDQLALSFSRSVSEYLMGDIVTQQQLTPENKVRSCDNLVKATQDEDQVEAKSQAKKSLTPAELDAVMVGLEVGLDLALQRAKAWSRYTRDIISYIEKKSLLELEYAKNLSRIANSMQPVLTSEGFLPLQSVFCTSLSQDAEFASNLQASHAVIHTSKFVEPLTTRRSEHDRVRKSVKETWEREIRRMQDTVSNLRKAQALYVSRQQEFERAREAVQKSDGEKLEKRRKLEEEAMHKAAEAETTYKACVAEANHRQRALEKTKAELLAKIREQINVCDQVIKMVAVEYFNLLHTVWSPVPVQYQTLSESSNSYETGCQYAEFIKRLPASASRQCRSEEFSFEPYIPGQKPGEARKTSVHSNGSSGEHIHSNEGSPVSSPRRDKYRSPVRAWGQTGQPLPQAGSSDTDSASGSTKSHESSPSSSPHNILRRQIVSSQSLDELTEEDMERMPAQDRRSHMKRTMTVSGEDSLELPGILNQRGRRNTMFGVDFQEQVERYKSQVPPIITKCLAEIERRGVMIKGIYRVSGVKSKVESLCQRFDINPELVDLEEVHPNIISNVLKLYLRQLPEPLLTFRLYSDFIHLAKENMAGYLVGDKVVERLSSLVAKLPPSNFRTCAVLMHHLHRVASHSDLNQMSSSNLGIVFGPTLLRPLEGTASLASLVDTPHQTRAIELLISNAEMVFGPGDDYQLVPDQTPVEAMEGSAKHLTIIVPTSSTEPSPSPEKSPTKEIGEQSFSAVVPTTNSVTAPSTASATVAAKLSVQENKIPVVTDASDMAPRLELSAADFSLPGSASHDRYDSIFVDNASTPFADETRSTMSDSASTKDVSCPVSPKTKLAETDPAPDTTLIALQPIATLIDSSTWPGPAIRSAASILASPTIPASPTIVARSGSSGSTGSDGRLSPTKGDGRTDRFKLEQRKLLSAIKSDPKVSITVVGEGELGSAREDRDLKDTEQGQESGAENELESVFTQDEDQVSGLEKKAEKSVEVRGGVSEGKTGEVKAGLQKSDSRAKKTAKSDVRSPSTSESSVRGVKLGTTVSSTTPRPASGPAATKPAGSSARVRTSAASAIQRRSNITGISSGSVVTSTTTPSSTNRSSLARPTPGAASAISASRRSLGGQPSASASHLRVSSTPATTTTTTTPQRTASSPSGSPSRHGGFESSLRSYDRREDSKPPFRDGPPEAAGNAARTRRISGERSHGSVRDMTPGTQTKTGLTSSPTTGSVRTLATAKAAAVAGARVASGGAGAAGKSAASSSSAAGGISPANAAGLTAASKPPVSASAGPSAATSPSGLSMPPKITAAPSSVVSCVSFPCTTASTTTIAAVTQGEKSTSPSANESGVSTPSTTTGSSAGPKSANVGASGGSRFHEKCEEGSGGSDSHPQSPQQGVTKDLSQDRTPRFV